MKLPGLHQPEVLISCIHPGVQQGLWATVPPAGLHIRESGELLGHDTQLPVIAVEANSREDKVERMLVGVVC